MYVYVVTGSYFSAILYFTEPVLLIIMLISLLYFLMCNYKINPGFFYRIVMPDVKIYKIVLMAAGVWVLVFLLMLDEKSSSLHFSPVLSDHTVPFLLSSCSGAEDCVSPAFLSGFYFNKITFSDLYFHLFSVILFAGFYFQLTGQRYKKHFTRYRKLRPYVISIVVLVCLFQLFNTAFSAMKDKIQNKDINYTGTLSPAFILATPIKDLFRHGFPPHDTLYRRGVFYMSKGFFEPASSCFIKSRCAEEFQVYRLYNTAFCLEQTARIQLAVMLYMHILRIEPDFLPASLGLYKIYRDDKSQAENALMQLRNILRIKTEYLNN